MWRLAILKKQPALLKIEVQAAFLIWIDLLCDNSNYTIIAPSNM
ncbi:hypothetical protein HMPREF9098_2246 [Kingella denitrificans ATCC 33394]|uniref:Uncharacterized protein n=1 Tax=Kingella denitrificans ATCC 33394 TaxID=888741 RepID=F0F2B1_9NEIS|nr:hypothetical protein HMPREF9098_2246 [Kingella denitrificans ATCC 33394]